jgi:ATP-dependent Clp protease protease subunit
MTKKPLRIFEGSAQPYTPFWRVIDAESSESGEPEIEFYGYISEFSWFEDDITPQLFRRDLNEIGKGGPVTIRIHSGGGDVFAASAIRAMIMDYPGRVTTRIDGLCASAATYVATAGDVVKMQDSAFLMVHDPWTIAVGSVEDLKAAIDLLKTVKEGIIQAYQSKTSLDAETLAKMMSDETWMTAQEALELGFVDEIVTAPAKALAGLRNAAVLNCLRNYEKVPTELLAGLENAPAGDGEPAEDAPVEDISEDAAEEDASSGAVESDAEAQAEETEGQPEEPEAESQIESEARRLRDYLEIFGPRRLTE